MTIIDHAIPGALRTSLERHAAISIAVSGGVDSMTLAFLARRFTGTAVTVVHALSPAVPGAATARVRDHAARHGWHLICIEAGEMTDPAYRANPVDRCFHCKSNLYAAIQAATGLPIASGTNRDDLADYRPGLEAAKNFDVFHPFVEAGIGKQDIYALARRHGLTDLADLPAQPCLASRIETGIPVDAQTLGFIESVEFQLKSLLPAGTILRCRITVAGIHVECAPVPEGSERRRLETRATELCTAAGKLFAGLRPYHRGSAFLRETIL